VDWWLSWWDSWWTGGLVGWWSGSVWLVDQWYGLWKCGLVFRPVVWLVGAWFLVYEVFTRF